MRLTIDGETFRVEVEGADDRPAVMLSPALGSDLSLFDAQMPTLLDHFRVVRYDPRGHGGSTIAGAPYSLARLGADALAILDALAIETTHFVGVSMGGAVGQWLLVNAPQRIDRAVLANTAARLGSPEVWYTRIVGVLAHGMQPLASATMERWFTPSFHARAQERVAVVNAVFLKTAAEGYAGACAALRDMDQREAILSIDRPVLIVTGREDAVASAADIEAMTAAIRGAEHLALDCRHISNIEQDTAFNAAVVGFLTAPMPARAARVRKPPTRRRAGSKPATAARSPLKPSVGRGSTQKEGSGKSAAGKTDGKPATRRTPPDNREVDAARAVPETIRTKVARETAARKTAANKASTEKSSAKKTSPEKTIAKTSPAKKATPKKPAPRRPSVTQRRPSPKRPGGSGRRPNR